MSLWWLAGLFIASFSLVPLLHWLWQRWMLERELYPEPRQTSLADVKRLLKEGHRNEAILRYLQKFPQVDLREAVYAVDSLK